MLHFHIERVIDEEEYIRNCFIDTDNNFVDTDRTHEREIKETGTTGKSSRKKILYTKHIIPPDDIRRTFPKWMESAWNSYDRVQLHDMFHGFASNELLTVIAYPNGNPHGPSYRELHGPQATTDYYLTYMSSVPDSLFFIHETKFIIRQNSNVGIVCKFTITGSRLFMIGMKGQTASCVEDKFTAVRSELLDSAAAAETTSATTNVKSPRGGVSTADDKGGSGSGGGVDPDPDLDLDEFLDGYNAFKQQLVFKDGTSVKNKHDKYRRLNHSTMGEYVDYSRLADPNLLQQTCTGSSSSIGRGAVVSGSGSPVTSLHSSDGQQGISAVGRSKGKKRRLSGADGIPGVAPPCCSSSLPSSSSSSATNLTAIDSARRQSADRGEGLVSGSNARFALTDILPSAVRSNIFGIVRFHIGADKKVYRLEFMCAFQEKESDKDSTTCDSGDGNPSNVNSGENDNSAV